MFESLLGFVLILTPLVFFHELGHFALARFSGVKVLVFSVGFGRELFGFTDRHGTRWRFSLIPLGGYVKMFGESHTNSANEDGLIGEKKVVTSGAFSQATLWQRLSIIAAGPLANVILTVLILATINFSYGVLTAPEYLESGVGEVVMQSPADKAGIQKGDVIYKMNQKEITDFQDIISFMQLSNGAEFSVMLKRNNQTVKTSVIPESKLLENSNMSRWLFGVSAPSAVSQAVSFIEAIDFSMTQTLWMSKQIISSISGLLNGTAQYNELGGPIKIAQFSGESLGLGLQQFLFFAAMLSINLALINLLPIPGLDGGHITLLILELILRREPPAKLINVINSLGMIFVLSLVVLITVKDVFDLFQ